MGKKAKDKYAKYLKSSHWYKVRKQYLANHLYRCAKCGMTHGILHLHHKTYKNLGNERMEDLQLLCEDCHSQTHIEILEKKLIGQTPKAQRKIKRRIAHLLLR